MSFDKYSIFYLISFNNPILICVYYLKLVFLWELKLVEGVIAFPVIRMELDSSDGTVIVPV
jgi:hypothetical protein